MGNILIFAMKTFRCSTKTPTLLDYTGCFHSNYKIFTENITIQNINYPCKNDTVLSPTTQGERDGRMFICLRPEKKNVNGELRRCCWFTAV